MSTELATVDQVNEMAMFGGEAFEERLDIINVQMVQNKHVALGRTPKTFFDPVSGMEFASFNAVPLKLEPQRTLFPPGEFQKGVQPICRSTDGVFPVLDDENIVPQCESCVHTTDSKAHPKGSPKCQHAIWKQMGKKRIKPACQEQFRLTFVDTITGLIFRTNIKGANMSDFGKLRKGIQRIVMISKQLSKDNPLKFYSLAFTMRPTAVSKPTGDYYQIIFGDAKPLKNVNEYQPLFQLVQANKINEPTEESGEDIIDSEV